MNFITYIANKINKAGKEEANMLWAVTSITRKELWIFNKNIADLDLDTYVRVRGEKKAYEVEGYKIEFGLNEWTLDHYTRVETPEGVVFEINSPKYKNQTRAEVRFFVGAA